MTLNSVENQVRLQRTKYQGLKTYSSSQAVTKIPDLRMVFLMALIENFVRGCVMINDQLRSNNLRAVRMA